MTPGTRPVSAAVIARVRRLRKDRRISAQQLADRMNQLGYTTSRGGIARAETGDRREISVDWLFAACNALGVPMTSVLYGPNCTVCHDVPPHGYSCNACGKAAT